MIADVAALFLTGLVALLGQIVLLRELNVAFYGIELIYIIGLGFWMLLTAAGALIGGRHPSASRTATLFVCLAVFLPLSVVFLRASRLLMGGIPGAYLPFPLQMAALFIALLPSGLLSGLLFREAATLHAERGRTLAGAYGIESAGSLAGGVLATLCFRYGIQNFSLAVACGIVAAAAAFFIFPGKGARPARIAAALVALFLAAVLNQAPHLDRRMTGWNHPGLLTTRDSPYGRITATARAGQVSVFTNDALAFESGGTEAELFAHLTALQHPEPRRILLLGGGWDGTLRELLRHRPVRIDAVVFDPASLALLRRHLPADIRASLADPAVRLTGADPRHFLKDRGFAWDLILVGMPEPSSGETNRFYTREFFAQCAARLHPGGIVALRLPAAENLWTPMTTRRTASVYRALASVFPEVLVLPGAMTVMTASAAPLPRSPEVLTDRLQERGLQARLVSPPYIRYLFTNDRFADVEKLLKETDVPENTDIRPVCYPYAVISWLARFFPGLALADLTGIGADGKGIGKLGWGVMLGMGIGLALLFLGSRLRPAWQRGLLAAVAGFLGIVSESVLLLAYQAKEGVLYQEIGLLLAAFMAGLALGAPTLRDLILGTGVKKRRTRGWGYALLAGFSLLGFSTIGIVTGGTLGGLLPTAVLLAAAGFLVGGLFAYAGLRGVREQKNVIGPLYAADLIGGGIGALCGSLILIPLLGLSGTLTAMILLAALAILLI
jgi:spermidine synthase